MQGIQAWFSLGTNNDNYITTGTSGITVFRAVGTERARIDSSGRVLVGITGASGFGQLETTTFTTTGQCILARTSGNVGIGTTYA